MFVYINPIRICSFYITVSNFDFINQDFDWNVIFKAGLDCRCPQKSLRSEAGLQCWKYPTGEIAWPLVSPHGSFQMRHKVRFPKRWQEKTKAYWKPGKLEGFTQTCRERRWSLMAPVSGLALSALTVKLKLSLGYHITVRKTSLGDPT